MTFSSLLSASKLSGVMLLMFSLGACREEAPASASNDPSATGLSSKIGENPDPDLEVVPEGESINEVDCSVLHAAKLYEEYSGRRVIMTHEIAKTEISFNMSGPLTNREAERFLQLTLLAEGIAMIPIPEEEDIVRLVAAVPITTLGPSSTEFFTDVSELPEEDELVLFQMIFEHLKPEDALEVLQAELGRKCPLSR